MKRKSYARALLMVFAFAVMSGGCGGSGGGDSWDGIEYNFVDLEGTWELVSGSGSGIAWGSYNGYSFSGDAKALSGTAKIWGIEVTSNEAANGEFEVRSWWDVTVNLPGVGSVTETIPVDFDSSAGEYDPDSPERLKKTGPNVFVIQGASAGSGFTESGTMTIKLFSDIRAEVTIRGAVLATTVGRVDYDVKFTVSKVVEP